MDDNRIDTLARALIANGGRRQATALALAGLMAVVSAGGAAGKRKGRKQRRCKRRLSLRAKWCLKLSKDRCRAVPKPDGTVCEGDGQCLAGYCNPRPTCQGVSGSTCTSGDDCCSEECTTNSCQPGAAGRECYEAADCVSGECVGYRCT